MVTFDSTDLDGAQEDSGTVHENVTNTDNTDASQLKKGYSNQPPALMNGLVGWWPIHDETAQDYSGSGNDGTRNGATTGVAGRGGLQAMSFDGTDDWIDVASSSVSGGPPFSISGWAKFESTGTQHIYSESNLNQDDEFILFRQESGPTFVFRYGEEGTFFDISTPINTGEWYHFVGTVDSNASRLYVNGSLETTGSGTTQSPTGFNNTDIGRIERQAGASGYMDGTISDVRVYNRALTSSEIQTLYEWGSVDVAKPADNNDGGISYYSFNSSNANDQWGADDGIVNGATYLSNGGPRSDGAYSYDGTDDWIGLPFASYPMPSTVSAWVYLDAENSNFRHIFSNFNGTTDDLALNKTDTGEFQLLWDAGSNILSGVQIAPGVWHNFTVVFRSSGTDIYHNGTREATSSVTSGTVNNGTSFNIGRSPDGARYWDGEIDDVRIYDRALSPSEVHELYQYGTLGRDMRDILVRA